MLCRKSLILFNNSFNLILTLFVNINNIRELIKLLKNSKRVKMINYTELLNFISDFDTTIKNTLLIPLGFKFKVIDSGKYSTLGYIDNLDELTALYSGSIEDIYQFLLHVIKVNYFRNYHEMFNIK